MLVRCYDRLFDFDGPLLHEPEYGFHCEASWNKLMELQIARRHVMGDRTFFYSPHFILARSIEALCAPPRVVLDASTDTDLLLDALARLLIHPVEEYLLVYDSVITPDSPSRQLLMSQFRTTPYDLSTVTISAHSLLPSSPTMTQRIRQVASRVYRKTSEKPVFDQGKRVKTVFLLDFVDWRLEQLLRLCRCFATSRIMSRAHATWVALNLASTSMTDDKVSGPLDPIEWTRHTTLQSVLAWFDVNFIKK